MINRSSGVLLNISSLPSDFGIGDFGDSAIHFSQEFLDMGFHWWQLLPITTIGKGDSPYSGISLRAGNYLYIDPYSLVQDDLLTLEEIYELKYKGDPYLVNYEHAKWAKRIALEKAYLRYQDDNLLDDFIKENSEWIIDYALFMCLREDYNNDTWDKWDNDYKYHNEKALLQYEKDNSSRLRYYYFEQYIFFKQWFKLKKNINMLGMGIIGDLPIYPSYDSVEVWSNPREYYLDNDMQMKKIAGVPPDAFSESGQLWNNPIYDYDIMKKNNYKTIKDRIRFALNLYDILRIDHYCGYYKYWASPQGSDSSINGEWHKAPGNEILAEFSNENIIVEDLGASSEDIKGLLDKTDFPGMRVMQFGFMDDESIHLPHYYPVNCVAYTSTHDNDPTLGWLYKLDESKRTYVLKYCGIDTNNIGWGAGGGDCPSTKAFIRTLLSTTAKLAIVAFQDLCGYGSDTRMNIPGKPTGNWKYRATFGALSSINSFYMHEMNSLYARLNPFVKL